MSINSRFPYSNAKRKERRKHWTLQRFFFNKQMRFLEPTHKFINAISVQKYTVGAFPAGFEKEPDRNWQPSEYWT